MRRSSLTLNPRYRSLSKRTSGKAGSLASDQASTCWKVRDHHWEEIFGYGNGRYRPGVHKAGPNQFKGSPTPGVPRRFRFARMAPNNRPGRRNDRPREPLRQCASGTSGAGQIGIGRGRLASEGFRDSGNFLQGQDIRERTDPILGFSECWDWPWLIALVLAA